ncbi:hypothetical protein [Paraburkholderia dinghuensis]|uniref:Uncharacterized protein n=1 Tax=Paraburkholderia dinghuensis TaxID=2305225 RepID=A0A3N6N8D2_9BURK|nr:hypothetical protein [Paraburkholderia dinghuensis]RQH07141.1 hypothetical protein D1Y85_10830 [Paraburkholderia dinghuensis]
MQDQFRKAAVAAVILAASSIVWANDELLPVIRDIDTPSGWQLTGTSSEAKRSSSCVLTSIRLPFDAATGYYFHLGGLRDVSSVSLSFSIDEVNGDDIHDATYETLTFTDEAGHAAVYGQPVPDVLRNVRSNDFRFSLSLDHEARDTFLKRLGEAVSVTATVEASPPRTWTLNLEDSTPAVAAFDRCLKTIRGRG